MIHLPSTQSGHLGSLEDESKKVVEDYLKKAEASGELPAGSTGAARNLYGAFADGGRESVREAVSSVVGVGAVAGCSASPLAPVAALCGVAGSAVAKVIFDVFSSASETPTNPHETRAARFDALYSRMLLQLTDDRKGGGKNYVRAANQIAVLCNLYVDGVGYADNWNGQNAIANAQLDLNVTPQFGSAMSEVAWLVEVHPLAFGAPGEVLPEFASGYPGTDETQAARARFWNFVGSGYEGEGEMLYQTAEHGVANAKPGPGVLGTDNFAVAVSRVVFASNVAIEQKFLALVDDFAKVITDAYGPYCTGNCSQGAVRAMAKETAYDTLSSVRGTGNATVPYLFDNDILKIESHIQEQTGKLPQNVVLKFPEPSDFAYDPYGGFDVAPSSGWTAHVGSFDASDGVSTGALVLGALAATGLGYLAWRKWGKRR